MRLSHENLRVYQTAIQFLAFSVDLLRRFPKGYADLSDQLRRAALSIPLNIAEGAGKPGRTDGARYFGIARGSVLECGAVLDACAVLGIIGDSEMKQGKALLISTAAMLTRLCGIRKGERPEVQVAGSGSGSR